MPSPAIMDCFNLLRSMWDADFAAGLSTGLLQCFYLLQVFHGMGLPPRRTFAAALLCYLIRVCAVPSLMRLNCWAA
ncbi:hypothetical protein MRX96_035691 [Rhipicephalus microplus]